MKLINLTIALALSFFAISCGGMGKEDQDAQKTDSTKAATETYEGMVKINLSEHNIPAEIYIPSEKVGRPIIAETSWGSVEISIGDVFGIEIIPFGMNLKEKKAELDGDMVYQYDYIKETDNLLVYKSSIKDTDIKPEFRFFMQKTLGTDNYAIKSMLNKSFNEGAINQMVKSAKSLTAIPLNS